MRIELKKLTEKTRGKTLIESVQRPFVDVDLPPMRVIDMPRDSNAALSVYCQKVCETFNKARRFEHQLDEFIDMMEWVVMFAKKWRKAKQALTAERERLMEERAKATQAEADKEAEAEQARQEKVDAQKLEDARLLVANADKAAEEKLSGPDA